MVNKCVIVGCKTGHTNGPVKASFHIPHKRPELLPYWVKFINRKDWLPDPKKTFEVVCRDHFLEKYIIEGKSRTTLDWKIQPVPSENPGEKLEGSQVEHHYDKPRELPFHRVFQRTNYLSLLRRTPLLQWRI